MTEDSYVFGIPLLDGLEEHDRYDENVLNNYFIDLKIQYHKYNRYEKVKVNYNVDFLKNNLRIY